MAEGTVVIIGGTQGLGRVLAERYVEQGRDVLITGRDASRTQTVAGEIGSNVRSAALDLSKPNEIKATLADVQSVGRIALVGMQRDANSVRDYNIEGAIHLATQKLVGYTAVVHALIPAMHDDTSVLLFGGVAKDRPYPGSTTVTSVNGAVATMIRTLSTELAPVRFNALHPGIVGDSPEWKDKPAVIEDTTRRTLTGRLATMDDTTDAALFLLENRSVNGQNLIIDGGWVMTH